MAVKSAGILVYRQEEDEIEIFLVHPGGPFWKNKDEGAWSIPKGEYVEGEDPLEAAKREFKEETGYQIDGNFSALKPVRLKSGKEVMAWAIESNLDAAAIQSNTFSIEWPPKSGINQSFPEVDRAAWFSIAEAKQKMNIKQAELLDDLLEKLQGEAARETGKG